jgi:orotidine-5'-phosphate decarboxylase
VLRLAHLAKEQGVDGVVCSAYEATAIRRAMGPDFIIVAPGIRPSWAAANDQKRIVTPSDAVALGIDYLVIGRPITNATNPVDAARRIIDELENN